jgi:hypothetical protein
MFEKEKEKEKEKKRVSLKPENERGGPTWAWVVGGVILFVLFVAWLIYLSRQPTKNYGEGGYYDGLGRPDVDPWVIWKHTNTTDSKGRVISTLSAAKVNQNMANFRG